MSAKWPPERVERLKQMWASKLTFQEIADRLNVTRSAASGKIGRLKLYGRDGIKPRGRSGWRRAA